MPISASEALRLLNLGYRQMQLDFRRFAPDLFRGARQSLTSDASGYIYLPTTVYEVEGIWLQSNTDQELEKIDKRQMYQLTGWYHDGVNTTAGGDVQKRKIMLRNNGAVYASTAVYVEVTYEYADLSAVADPPYPFTGKGYQNMLTEIQTFFYYMEQGKEHAKDAEKHWNVYQHFLKEARKDM